MELDERSREESGTTASSALPRPGSRCLPEADLPPGEAARRPRRQLHPALGSCGRDLRRGATAATLDDFGGVCPKKTSSTRPMASVLDLDASKRLRSASEQYGLLKALPPTSASGSASGSTRTSTGSSRRVGQWPKPRLPSSAGSRSRSSRLRRGRTTRRAVGDRGRAPSDRLRRASLSCQGHPSAARSMAAASAAAPAAGPARCQVA